MKKMTLFALLIICSNMVIGQAKKNITLKKQLDSVMLLDQKYRDTLSLLMDPIKQDSMAKSLKLTIKQANGHYWTLQDRLDSLNVVFVEGVFKKYGYPGKSIVDTPTNKTAWFIIQHSEKIHQYIGMMKKAADENELPFHLYAMMLDRDLMDEGKEQIYGTQISCQKFKNIKDQCIVWPIKDPANVNERRKKAGFPTTVEQNATRLDVTYRVIKIEDVK
jgi:hypothetical protein